MNKTWEMYSADEEFCEFTFKFLAPSLVQKIKIKLKIRTKGPPIIKNKTILHDKCCQRGKILDFFLENIGSELVCPNDDWVVTCRFRKLCRNFWCV